MPATLEVLLTPAEFNLLPQRDLRAAICVVFDVLRATSTILTALANGAEAVVPVAEIEEALAWRARQSDVLLAGERDGVRIRGALTGGVDFDLGNSPREFTPERVRGRTIVSSTTNGTRALRACRGAHRVLVGAFLNLQACADWLLAERPAHLLLVCSGTVEQAAYEDALAAGALCDLVWAAYDGDQVADSARMVRALYQAGRTDLLATLLTTRNARRLRARPELRDDLPFCAQRDLVPFVADLGPDGAVRRR